MPHYACLTCRTRVRHAPKPATEPCSQCGGPLEPVVDLADVVGFQLIDRRDKASSLLLLPYGAIAARLDEFMARRAERLERRQAVLAAACGIDSADPPADLVAVALRPPQPGTER